jgi:predicted DNA binding protein
MVVFPVHVLNDMVETLSKHAKANVLKQDTKPLEELELPSFSFDLFKAPKLTPEEEQILKVAYDVGWFEYPRPTGASVADIANKLAASTSTVDIRLRTISRKLCRNYFERYGP